MSLLGRIKLANLGLALLLALNACGQPEQQATPQVSASAVVTQTPLPSTPRPEALWVSPVVPAALREQLSLPQGWQQVGEQVAATTRLEVLASGQADSASQWVYALVAPFPTLRSEVSLDELRGAWAGSPARGFNSPLLVEQSTLQVFSALWGAPADGAVEVLPAQDILDAAWAAEGAWAIIPFEQLQPRWRVLAVDGQSPLRNTFIPETYPLTVYFGFSANGFSLPPGNRDSQKLTVVAMTGVTALVRATAAWMLRYGLLYPAQDIGDLLRTADITHISNEVPFTPDCPPLSEQAARLDALIFCSDPAFITLMEHVSTDVVELTGDHFADYGPQAMVYTLDLYDQRGWPYYGGGRDISDALRPALFEHNGNKIAFIGCNAKGGGYATAKENQPGAGKCIYDVLHPEIGRLDEEGYLVIASFSHIEYYTYQVLPAYRPDFIGMIDAGATIVQGSQAHQAQNFEFYEDGFIHYGLGNLFFDQYDRVGSDGLPLDRAVIDLYTVYEGRLIGMEIVPIRFVDYARPRLMGEEEAAPFLRELFRASGWLGGKPFPWPED